MTLAARREALELAEQALALVQAEPLAGRNLADEALDLARAEGDTEAQVAALHALGFAQYALGDPGAIPTMRSAIRVGERHNHLERAARARRNLAVYLAYAGKVRAALREIDAAQAALQGVERARTEVFRIPVYWLAGRGAEAVAESAPALHTLRSRGDLVWEARLLYNRAAVLTKLGRHRPARSDLERAHDLYATLGLHAAASDALIELGRVRFREGDYVGCLAELDRIDVVSLTDWAACWLYLWRAEALVALRLLPEARADLGRFEERSRSANAAESLNQGRLDAARIAIAAGDPAAAIAIATSARRSFAARGQLAFSSEATLVALAAAAREGSVSRSRLNAGSRAARYLEENGRTLDALRGRLVIARAATVGGYGRGAESQLAAARSLERRGTVIDRIELRYVDALTSVDADPRQAERRLRSGLDLLESHRATLGAADLRATASALGVDLSRLGVSIAAASGDTASLLGWAERLRGNALRLPATGPSTDRRLRRERDELRMVDRAVQRAEKDARAARSLGSRRVELETTVRTHARLLRGSAHAGATRLDLAGAQRVLGDRALVEYVDLDGRLQAIALSKQTLARHDLGAVDVSSDLEWLRFALRRLARGRLDPAAHTATLANARTAATALDGKLIAPLHDASGTAPLVIVPTGPLHAVPWGALPSLRGRPVTVAPSLSTWLDLAQRPKQRRRKSTLVAGPGLRHARAEVRGLHELLPDATVLTGKEATVDATLAALDGATLAHVACHGRFRADSPLFSSLELADGPLTALDIQGLRAPDMLVLSACDVALSERHPGDELLGLSAALLASGTRTIVASVVPVPDAAARRLMLAFHRRLAAGASPAAALAEAQAGLRADRSALAGFLCLGVG